MKNIHILPTDKPSRLFEILQFNFVFDNQNKYSEEYKKLHSYKNQNIYITSDEEIKEGDCFLPQGHINPHKLKEYNKINGDLESYNGLCYDISKCKKIILTTDADLIKEGVQAIDDEFLEWFVQNPSCEFVDVKSLKTIPALQLTGNNHCMYQLIVPKEEPEQETQGYICPQTKKQCNDECCVSAEDCHIEASFGIISDCEPPKQETLEEATLTPIENKLIEEAKKVWEESHPNPIEMALFGFNWREKKSKNKYSKKEVNKLLNTLLKNNMCSHAGDELIKKFKKK